MNYTLKITFAVFDFDELSITIPVFSNELCFNDGRNENNEKENEKFSSFEKLLFNVEKGIQKSQKSNLKSNEDKNANTDNSNIHSENDDSIFITGSKIKYDL